MAKKKSKKQPKQKKAKGNAEMQVHDGQWIKKQIKAFAKDIIAQGTLDHALIVGIRRRGAELAKRVRNLVEKETGMQVPFGALDITLYRDDIGIRGTKIAAHKEGTRIEGPIDHRLVFLIDDVLCTGRTIRAALDELKDFGRPGAVRLYSLIDRGGRELPIQPDRFAARMSVRHSDRVEVRLKEVDGEEGIFVVVGGVR